MLRRLIVQRGNTFTRSPALFRHPFTTECGESTQVTSQHLETKLKSKLESPSIHIQDLTGNGNAFQVDVASSTFNNLPLIKQHQLVNSILSEEIAKIHAITINTRKKEETKKE